MNTITVLGRLGKDAEMVSTTSGNFLSMTLASDEFNGKANETIWYNITYSINGMERLAEYLKKGRMIVVTGSLKPRKYADREGRQQTSLDIRAYHIDFVRIAQQNQQEDTTKPVAEPTTGPLPMVTPSVPFPPTQPQDIDGNVDSTDLPF